MMTIKQLVSFDSLETPITLSELTPKEKEYGAQILSWKSLETSQFKYLSGTELVDDFRAATPYFNQEELYNGLIVLAHLSDEKIQGTAAFSRFSQCIPVVWHQVEDNDVPQIDLFIPFDTDLIEHSYCGQRPAIYQHVIFLSFCDLNRPDKPVQYLRFITRNEKDNDIQLTTDPEEACPIQKNAELKMYIQRLQQAANEFGVSNLDITLTAAVIRTENSF